MHPDGGEKDDDRWEQPQGTTDDSEYCCGGRRPGTFRATGLGSCPVQVWRLPGWRHVLGQRDMGSGWWRRGRSLGLTTLLERRVGQEIRAWRHRVGGVRGTHHEPFCWGQCVEDVFTVPLGLELV